jgi:predicted DNA-binding transcriptional regulator YafY
MEEWHPRQRERWEKDGSYVLEVPFSSDRELIMDILKMGPDVEVVGPPQLRKQVADRARLLAQRYRAD